MDKKDCKVGMRVYYLGRANEELEILCLGNERVFCCDFHGKLDDCAIPYENISEKPKEDM